MFFWKKYIIAFFPDDGTGNGAGTGAGTPQDNGEEKKEESSVAEEMKALQKAHDEEVNALKKQLDDEKKAHAKDVREMLLKGNAKAGENKGDFSKSIEAIKNKYKG